MSDTSDPRSDAARRERPSRHWKRYRNPLLVGSAAVVLAGGLALKHHLAGYQTTDDAQVDAHLYAISGRVPGYVLAVHANDNQYVKQGEVLVELDPTDYQLSVAGACRLANSEATAASLSVLYQSPLRVRRACWLLCCDVQSAMQLLAAKEQARPLTLKSRKRGE